MTLLPPADVPGWSRETPRAIWDPGRRLLQTIRKYQSWGQRKGLVARLMMKVWVAQHRFWSIVTAAEIPLDCEIEGGLLIPHPNGIVIHPHAKIGPNRLIFQQVTLGTRGESGAPVIEGHVDIGAGAPVLGNVVIRDYSKIGANALVLSSFPPSLGPRRRSRSTRGSGQKGPSEESPQSRALRCRAELSPPRP